MNSTFLNSKINACPINRFFPAIKCQPFKGLLFITLLCSIPLAKAVEPLSVRGNQLVSGGQPVSFAGNSLFWSNDGGGGEKYYNSQTVEWLNSNWHSKIVRAAMVVEVPGGYLSAPQSNKQKVMAVVDAAIARDMYVIIDWHSHHAELYQQQAIAFFQEMASIYGANNNVIYEIYNEPLKVSWSGTIKPYAQAVIAAIREIDPDNLIVVGTSSWSQDVDAASLDPITGYNNIAYTLHFYAGSHTQWLRDKANVALENGIALFVTEWGSVNADGDGDVAEVETGLWMDFLGSKAISHCNWAINDKVEGASALYPGASVDGGWSDAQLTTSGALARKIIRDWNGGTTPPPPPSQAVTIQAESFAYMSGVGVESTVDGGSQTYVGWIDAGDWMSYPSVELPTSGTYTIEYRVASPMQGGRLQIEEAGGNPVYGSVAIPNSGGWHNWTTIRHTVELTAGSHNFGIAVPAGGWNINWFSISPGIK